MNKDQKKKTKLKKKKKGRKLDRQTGDSAEERDLNLHLLAAVFWT